jgi:hypothetical protein
MAEHLAELSAGELTAVIGDNSARGEHRAGYNGVWSLQSAHQPESLFVPLFAGMNLEHVMDGRDLASEDRVFEPRRAPMELHQSSDVQAELRQPPTPSTKVESWTTFTLVPPHYLDFVFRCRATEAVLPYDYVGFFWASYIQHPEDKTIHFIGKVRSDMVERMWPAWHDAQWLEFRPAFQSDRATVCWEQDDPRLPHDEETRPILYTSFSHLCYVRPFYYGLCRGMCLQYMFDRTTGIRFTNGVTGAGAHNPAWDFQWIVRPVEVGDEYTMRARAVYKPFVSREDCVSEYEAWTRERGTNSEV